jgi:hypothetical protein
MITTYQSFTTANQLLDKLIQRYEVPPHKVDIDDPKLIKLKVIQIIQYWIENNSYDFDQPFVDRMKKFISVHLPNDGFKEMALNLTELLNQKVNARLYLDRIAFNVPQTDFFVSTRSRSSQ